MKSATEFRHELGELWLTTLAEQYKDSAETWNELETKAQGTVTVAGIFLAAVFAFARDSSSIASFPRTLLALTAVLLVASVAAALLSLEIRQVVAPPLGDFVEPGVRDLMRLSDEELTKELVAMFVVDRAAEWKAVNASLSREI